MNEQTNNPLTKDQALNRCLEWFTHHQPTAVLPGTKGTAVSELQNVLAMEPPFKLSLQTIKDTIVGDELYVSILRNMVECWYMCWYMMALKKGLSEDDALQETLDNLAKTLLKNETKAKI